MWRVHCCSWMERWTKPLQMCRGQGSMQPLGSGTLEIGTSCKGDTRRTTQMATPSAMNTPPKTHCYSSFCLKINGFWLAFQKNGLFPDPTHPSTHFFSKTHLPTHTPPPKRCVIKSLVIIWKQVWCMILSV